MALFKVEPATPRQRIFGAMAGMLVMPFVPLMAGMLFLALLIITPLLPVMLALDPGKAKDKCHPEED